MSLLIDSSKAGEKIDVFLCELEKLIKLPFYDGEDRKNDLDIRIRTFVNATFSDGRDKLRSYTGLAFAIAGYEKTREEKQKDYEDSLKRKKRHLIAWKEEIELSMDVNSKSSELDKLKSKIEETNLESLRRKKVVETKFFGAVIELLDFQRNLIKEKEQNTKAIIKIQQDIEDMKNMLTDILKNENDAEKKNDI